MKQVGHFSTATIDGLLFCPYGQNNIQRFKPPSHRDHDYILSSSITKILAMLFKDAFDDQAAVTPWRDVENRWKRITVGAFAQDSTMTPQKLNRSIIALHRFYKYYASKMRGRTLALGANIETSYAKIEPLLKKYGVELSSSRDLAANIFEGHIPLILQPLQSLSAGTNEVVLYTTFSCSRGDFPVQALPLLAQALSEGLNVTHLVNLAITVEKKGQLVISEYKVDEESTKRALLVLRDYVGHGALSQMPNHLNCRTCLSKDFCVYGNGHQ